MGRRYTEKFSEFVASACIQCGSPFRIRSFFIKQYMDEFDVGEAEAVSNIKLCVQCVVGEPDLDEVPHALRKMATHDRYDPDMSAARVEAITAWSLRQVGFWQAAGLDIARGLAGGLQ